MSESSTYTFPPISKLSDVPPAFNPEPSCHAEFVGDILGRYGAAVSAKYVTNAPSCVAEGPTRACCGLVKEALKPSSAAWFASCMCKRDFWAAATALFEQGGHSLPAVLDRCIDEVGASVQYLGQPSSACPQRTVTTV